MVYIYAGATAGVAGVVQGMQKGPDLTRACRGECTSQLAVALQGTDWTEYTQLEGSDLESRADCAGS